MRRSRTITNSAGVALFLSIAAAYLLAACTSESEENMTPVNVEIVARNGGFELLRAGKPYVINGAGMAVDDLANFAARGGNSIRNWSTNADYQDTMALLDTAQKHGVTVSLCLSFQAERHGFDYDNAEAVAAQLQRSCTGSARKSRSTAITRHCSPGSSAMS